MILRLALLASVLGSCLVTTLFAGGERGNHLIAEAGGTPGIPGAVGIPGASGLPGLPGIPGGTATVLAGADFYALMPADNAAPIPGGSPVAFPHTTVGTSFGGIVNGGTSFTLTNIGTYLVLFQASVTEPGQLMLTLNGVPQANTVVGRATGTSQIVGIAFVTTVAPLTTLQVINPAGNLNITITPKAGQAASANSVSAHLTILQIE